MNTLLQVGLVSVSLLAGVVAPAVGSAQAAAPAAALRRFALIASSNDGGPSRVRLRFANSDARSMAEVLRQLGGLRDDDLLLLPDATRGALQGAFAHLRNTVAGAAEKRARRELVVYYSGHSDEEGLLLAGEHVSYPELREWIAATDVEVRIAVLDSCASGAIIRHRGVSRRPPFLSDIGRDARGYVFLTASSADEAAQESERIGAAFFTHYLVSGLRGAADRSRDGRVTLGEAYDFAYDHTLQRTVQTASGAQHPAYDFQLAGTGDLVLTDLHASSANLVLDEKVAGHIFVRDASGRLLIELRKETAHPVQLGLAAGEYDVALDSSAGVTRARVKLADGDTTHLGGAQFALAEAQPTTARGDAEEPKAPAGAAAAPEQRSLAASLIGESSLIGQMRQLGGYVGVDLRYARVGKLDGFAAGADAALLFNRRFALGVAGGGIRAPQTDEAGNLIIGYGGIVARYHYLVDASPYSLSLGAMVAAAGVSPEQLPPPEAEGSKDDVVLIFEPQLGGHLDVTRFLRLGVDVGYRLLAYTDRYSNKSLRGLSAGIHARVGWF